MGVTTWHQTPRRIHVETVIRASFERVWQHTQSPDLHARWDARFTSIEPIDDETDLRRRFLYTRRLLPGITIRGFGEAVGRRRPDGTATSALVFWSADRRSLIRRGSGYWRFQQTTDGVLFLTEYDYEPRWGAAGRLIDRLAFRPAIAWLTARSFERLRIWLETGRAP